MPYISTIEQLAIQAGRQRGMLLALEWLLMHRFGELSGKVQASMKKLSYDQMRELLIAQIEFKTKTDLHNWLKRHAGQNGSPRKRNGTRTKKESK